MYFVKYGLKPGLNIYVSDWLIHAYGINSYSCMLINYWHSICDIALPLN